jgi:hypothetical protein
MENFRKKYVDKYTCYLEVWRVLLGITIYFKLNDIINRGYEKANEPFLEKPARALPFLLDEENWLVCRKTGRNPIQHTRLLYKRNRKRKPTRHGF